MPATPGEGPERVNGEETITLTFDDNRLLPALFGEHDRHLSIIEDRLEVQLTPRGNHLSLHGSDEACRNVRHVLDTLYERLRDGLEVGSGDVEGAIRMLADAPARSDLAAPAATVSIKTPRRVVSPRSPVQGDYIAAIQTRELVFGTGPAGTGKTYIAVAAAAAALAGGHVDRIILSRPAVEAGERLGFLPGDMREKVDPYLRPLYDALYDVLPANRVVKGLEDDTIEIAPLAFMRGRSLTHAFIILDEAQNCTPMQMKMFLTRFGEGSRMVITGDPSQVDLPLGQKSGLADAVDLLEDISDVAHIAFSHKDVVRHPLVAKIVRAYEAMDARLRPDGGDNR
jgi:phosphate starvation-inducible PhoH-like protein